jgi:hypothetical protein
MEMLGDINPFLRAIGRLVMNFNALEHLVRRLTWSLIDPGDERTGQIVLNALGAARIEELADALVRHRVGQKDICEEFAAVLKDMGAVRIRRNDFVHAFWRVPNDATDLRDMEAARAPTRKATDYAPVTGSSSADAIEAVASDASRLFKRMEEMTTKVLAQLRGRAVANDR